LFLQRVGSYTADILDWGVHLPGLVIAKVVLLMMVVLCYFRGDVGLMSECHHDKLRFADRQLSVSEPRPRLLVFSDHIW
jgi:hypothetical protein